MGATSAIEWTEASWNPLVGCSKVSAGCDNCYAKTLVNRFAGKNKGFPNRFDVVTIRDDKMLTQPLRWRAPKRIFVNSLSDLFHDDVPDEFIARVWQVMGSAPQHTYQILTKRHARMRSWTARWYAGEIPEPYEVRTVPGYPGYTVSTLGEVFGKRADTATGLAQEAGEQGHRRVTMHREGSPRSGSRELVHRLVLTAFARPAKAGEQACHRNGDPSDNRLSNLYWGTQGDNWRDRIRHGKGRSYSKLTGADVDAIRHRSARGESAYRIAQDYPVSDTQIRNVLTGQHWPSVTVSATPVPPARVVLDCVWLGVSVENQRWADIRIPALLATPAAVRWISAEPLLGPVNLEAIPSGLRMDGGPRRDSALVEPCSTCGGWGGRDCPPGPHFVKRTGGIEWVVAGGESGPGARPMHPEWARSIRDQCVAAGVPFLFKQWGNWAPVHGENDWRNCRETDHHVRGDGYHWPLSEPHGAEDGTEVLMRNVGKKAAGRELDGRTWDEYPVVTA